MFSLVQEMFTMFPSLLDGIVTLLAIFCTLFAGTAAVWLLPWREDELDATERLVATAGRTLRSLRARPREAGAALAVAVGR